MSYNQNQPRATQSIEIDFKKHGAAPSHCSVCHSRELKHFKKVNSRYYWTCKICKARILSPQHWITPRDEFSHYQTHQNNSADPGYRRYASKLANPLMQKLTPRSKGLDYGSGPDPALAAILRENGHDMALFDPFFEPCKSVLEDIYDFVTCSEVAEHFYNPAKEFASIDKLVRPGGWIGVMTKFQTLNERFANWQYVRDPTHVVFYRKTTFEIIGKNRNWTPEFPCQDVVLFQKRSGLTY